MRNKIGIAAFLLVFTACAGNVRETEGSVNEAAVMAYDASESRIAAESKPANCKEAVMEILKTSPAFEEKTKGLHEAVVKNGGTSFGITLEGSPEVPKDDLEYSATYDFNLHENYPDRNVVVARYVFNAKQQQLYERDMADENKLTPIEFNRNLLGALREVCDSSVR